jgi:hypothetical integral membrane protein (TIGR02206 family)
MATAAERFEAFSAQHYVVLLLFAVGAVAVVLLGRAHRGDPRAGAFARGWAVAIAFCGLASQAYQLTPGDFALSTSLPLQLSDLAWMAATWALWTRSPVPVALTYYWGLTLTVQAVVTPSLAEAFPHPRFFAFWALHLLVVWAALYLSLGLGVAPTWSTYAVTVVVTLVWAVLVYAFNTAVDVNYGYLNRKPGSASLLDLLGPWPTYVFVSLAILLAGWALMTWPWTAVRRRRRRRDATARAPTSDTRG